MKKTKNVVLITGGTTGIGFEIAKKYLKLKWNVVVLGRNKYTSFPKTNDFYFVKGDVIKEISHKKAVNTAEIAPDP